MPTPDFILELRRSIGTAPLWLSGASAVIVDDDRVLLIRRSDTGEWTPVTGIVDPGEHPAVAAVREAAEEAGVVITADRLLAVEVTEEKTYDNGDRAQYLTLVFRCSYVSGVPRPVDGEALEVEWFPLSELPELSEWTLRHIGLAVANEPSAAFDTA